MKNQTQAPETANTQPKKIGFIGLGSMGAPMAKNLVKAGYHLQVYNRTMSKADELDQEFITRCTTPAMAAKNVQFVVTMVSDDDVLKEAVLGEGGLLHSLPKEAVHLSMSTISPDTSQLLSGLHIQAGSHYIAAQFLGARKQRRQKSYSSVHRAMQK